MISTRCLLCGRRAKIKELYPPTFSESDLTSGVYSARRMPDRVHYRLVRCERCGLIFSNPVLPPEKIAQLYTKAVLNYDAIRPFVTATYVKLVERHRFYLPANPTVLEIGCGNGFFLSALRSRFGWTRLNGVEPGAAMVADAAPTLKPKIICDVFREKQYPAQSMDLVCCFHTLDHMPDPEMMIRESMRILAPGGLLILVTHDTDNLSVKLMGERSPIFDIEHIYLFNRKNLGNLVTREGFTVVTNEQLVNTYPLWYWVRMAGVSRFLKTIANILIKISGSTDVPVSFAGGNLALIARKPIVISRRRTKSARRKTSRR